MRLLVALAVSLASLLFALPSLAQVPPNTLLAGSMWFSVVSNGDRACSISAGPSHFKRNGGGGPARIAFPELIYASYDTTPGTTNGPRNAFAVSGEARMAFTNPTTGKIIFDYNTDYPLDIRQPTFTQYSQTFDSATQQLSLTFVLRIRNCSVRVRGVYRV